MDPVARGLVGALQRVHRSVVRRAPVARVSGSAVDLTHGPLSMVEPYALRPCGKVPSNSAES